MDAKTFWDNTKNRIKEQNTTQEWVCKQANIVLGTMRQQITHDRLPPVDEAVGIAEALNTTVECLVGKNDPDGLSDDDRHLLDDWHELDAKTQAIIRPMITTAAENARNDKVNIAK